MNNIPLVNDMNALNNPDVTQSKKHNTECLWTQSYTYNNTSRQTISRGMLEAYPQGKSEGLERILKET